MIETNDWSTAPRDGRVFNCQFPDGSSTRARWNAQAGKWEVAYGGQWRPMNDTRWG